MKVKTLSTPEEIKAVTDPYRSEILGTFKQIGEPATVKQVADKMGEVPAKVHYHVKKLEKVGILKLVRTQEIKGIVAKFYEPIADSFKLQAKDNNQTTINIFKTQLERAVHNAYESSKEVIIKEIRKADIDDFGENEKEDEEDDQVDALIGSISSLRLSQEELQEVKAFFTSLSEKSKANKNDTSKKKYHFFYSMMELREDKKL